MFSLQTGYFDLNQIYYSKQSKSWFKVKPNKFLIYNSDKFLAIEQIGQRLVFDCNAQEFEYWYDYFDLKSPYDLLNQKMKLVNKKISTYSEGVHILNLDLWESIIFSILKQNGQIEYLRKIGEIHKSSVTNMGKHIWGEIPKYQEILDNKKHLKFLGPGKDILFYVCELIKSNELNLDYLKHLKLKEVVNYLGSLAFPKNVIAKICLNGLNFKQALPTDLKFNEFQMDKIREVCFQDEIVKGNIGLFYLYVKNYKNKKEIKNGDY